MSFENCDGISTELKASKNFQFFHLDDDLENKDGKPVLQMTAQRKNRRKFIIPRTFQYLAC